MDSHGIRLEHAATLVNIGGIMFDNNFYDREVDVLYLHVGEPSTGVDFDGTAAGDATRYGPDRGEVRSEWQSSSLDGALMRPRPRAPRSRCTPSARLPS